MTTRSTVVTRSSQPWKRLTAPSSSSMNSSAFFSPSSLTSGSSAGCAGTPGSATLLHRHALLRQVFLRPWMEGDRRADGLVLQVDVLGLLVDGDQVGLLLEQSLHDVVGHRVAHLVVGDQDVPHVDDLDRLVLARIAVGRNRALGIQGTVL